MAARVVLAALLFAPAGASICNFTVIPLFPGFFADPTCKMGDLGCLADGKTVECRFCGGGVYENISCAPSACAFVNEPYVPYYWDPTCKMGKLGCWADGIHAQCRFCGLYPYTSIDCPEYLSAPPKGAACEFNETSEPRTPVYWEPGCKDGKLGCKADGINVACRYCGKGAYASITCPQETRCTFADEPVVPYYWDKDCKNGMLGCLADGIHEECRFCRKRPFEGIPCPRNMIIPPNVCTWPQNAVPLTPFFWDETCEAGQLGCWADGLHAECRFCGVGAYANVTCPAGLNDTEHREFEVLRLTAVPAEQPDAAQPSADSSSEQAVSEKPVAVAKDVQNTTAAPSSTAGGKEIDINAARGAGGSGAVVLLGLAALTARA